jgi:long-chain acyl-CoA synthetase
MLAEDPDDPVLRDLLRPRPIYAPLAFLVVKTWHVCARLFLGLRVLGTENLPREGAFLISPNHQSYLDAFLLVGTLPYRTFRRLFFVGASEYFATPLLRRLARLINVVPVDPDANLVRAMQAGAFGLRHGQVLVLFPEGERSPDGTVRTFKKGASILAAHMRVPIVPVAIHGVFEIWPRGKAIRWSRLLPFTQPRPRFSFGRPVSLESLGPIGEAAAEHYLRLTAALRDAVVGMWTSLDRRLEH